MGFSKNLKANIEAFFEIKEADKAAWEPEEYHKQTEVILTYIEDGISGFTADIDDESLEHYQGLYVNYGLNKPREEIEKAWEYVNDEIRLPFESVAKMWAELKDLCANHGSIEEEVLKELKKKLDGQE
ncbi:hypothetical protein ACJ73_10362 [Blastomyces percursus]|uniref:Uncharacterized protein n=1 Tax=Blastomyces percursus TaxID=1658174 RepID=A0A1J9Q2I9_9EURO|nr:hypothetical protein ACJ73_10362 [Blastomyces percursus]